MYMRIININVTGNRGPTGTAKSTRVGRGEETVGRCEICRSNTVHRVGKNKSKRTERNGHQVDLQ